MKVFIKIKGLLEVVIGGCIIILIGYQFDSFRLIAKKILMGITNKDFTVFISTIFRGYVQYWIKSMFIVSIILIVINIIMIKKMKRRI